MDKFLVCNNENTFRSADSAPSSSGWSSIAPEEAKRALGRLQQEQEAALSSLEEEWKRKMVEREKEVSGTHIQGRAVKLGLTLTAHIFRSF